MLVAAEASTGHLSALRRYALCQTTQLGCHAQPSRFCDGGLPEMNQLAHGVGLFLVRTVAIHSQNFGSVNETGFLYISYHCQSRSNLIISEGWLASNELQRFCFSRLSRNGVNQIACSKAKGERYLHPLRLEARLILTSLESNKDLCRRHGRLRPVPR